MGRRAKDLNKCLCYAYLFTKFLCNCSKTVGKVCDTTLPIFSTKTDGRTDKQIPKYASKHSFCWGTVMVHFVY